MSDTTKQIHGKTTATVVAWFLGVGVTLSWNSVLTVGDYYYQLFPDYHPGRVFPLVSQPFSLIASAVYSSYASKAVDSRKRTLFGYALFTSSLIGLLVIDWATSGKGSLGTYIAVCALVASFGVASATVEGGVLGELSFMRPEFVRSFVAGLAASGALTSCLRLVTKASFDTTRGLRTGVVLFLATSAVFEFACVVVYACVFAKLPIVKHFRETAALEVAEESGAAAPVGNKQLIKQNYDYALAIFSTYALTLSIFPGFLYENTAGKQHELGSWYSLVLIAVFNAFDLVSRYVPVVCKSRRVLVIASLLRLLLVPCFYFTSKYGQEGWMIMLVSILGASNGYLTVCILTVAPIGYSAPEQNALGNLLVSFILTGLFSDACLDLLWSLVK